MKLAEDVAAAQVAVFRAWEAAIAAAGLEPDVPPNVVCDVIDRVRT